MIIQSSGRNDISVYIYILHINYILNYYVKIKMKDTIIKHHSYSEDMSYLVSSQVLLQVLYVNVVEIEIETFRK